MLKASKDSLKIKIDGNHLGIVIYAEKDCYPMQEEGEKPEKFLERTKNFHIQSPKEEVYDAICKELFDTFKVTVECGVVGHEHGTENGKCHMQCVFKLTKRTQKNFPPGALKMDKEKLLYMVGPVHNVQYAFHYCKKELDYYSTDGEDVPLDPYIEIANSKGLSKKDVVEILKRKDPKALLHYGDRVLNNWEAFQQAEEAPQDIFEFPKHLEEQINNPVILSQEDADQHESLKAIWEWYQEFCVSNKWAGQRKKALLMYSSERVMGKSEFAKRLVKDQRFLIHIKTNIDGRDFARAKSAKLIVIDDVKFKFEQEELWKALVSSEKSTISTKFCMHTWEGDVPTIILCNDLSLLLNMCDSPNFQTQVVITEVVKYLGPPGTRPEILTKKQHFLTSKTQQLLEKKRASDKKKGKLDAFFQKNTDSKGDDKKD